MKGKRSTDPPGGGTAEVVSSAKAILRAEGLAEVAEQILPHVKPSIELVPNERAARALSMGKSKIGGCPDLPATLRWPADSEKKPLSFLLQIALGDLPPNDLLPKDGMLSFFYDTMEVPQAAEALEGKAFRVLYLPPDRRTPLARREAPTGEDGPATDTFEEYSLSARVVPSFPDDLTLVADAAARRRYLDALVNPGCSVFKLLGNPNTIQTPMGLQCAALARGLGSEVENLPPTLRAQLRREAEDWVLLLQVDSSTELQLSWGDSGRLYWWSHRADLAKKRFDRLILLLQSH